MPKKFYAVKNGKAGAGIYTTWAECKAMVDGVPNVRYKGFATRAEAEAFLQGDTVQSVAVTKKAEKAKLSAPDELPYKENTAIAYVDGSYHKGTHEFAGGGVLFYNHEKVEFSQKNDDPELAEMHNVAGEIMGSVMVMRYCIEHGIPAVEIYHDYAGVACWATGEWKTNKNGTRAYASFCKKAMQHLNVRFVKVTGHSGDYWNDEADRLAKAALGIT